MPNFVVDTLQLVDTTVKSYTVSRGATWQRRMQAPCG